VPMSIARFEALQRAGVLKRPQRASMGMEEPSFREREVLDMVEKVRRANELITKALRAMILARRCGRFWSTPVVRSMRPGSSPMNHRGQAPLSGGRGRRFKSSHSDQHLAPIRKINVPENSPEGGAATVATGYHEAAEPGSRPNG
jgi:hypothetical protein